MLEQGHPKISTDTHIIAEANYPCNRPSGPWASEAKRSDHFLVNRFTDDGEVEEWRLLGYYDVWLL
jgi:hypothetical protein